MAKDTTLSFLFLHYPLPQHRFARISAQALECANRYGYAAPFMDLIYQKQDSIGLKSWESFGHEAGINDANEFSLCVTSADSIIDSRIDQAMLVASRLQVQSTPTVLINGWRFATPPNEAALLDAIGNLRRQKPVFKKFESRRF
jgi:protein-disulfide isomerase